MHAAPSYIPSDVCWTRRGYDDEVAGRPKEWATQYITVLLRGARGASYSGWRLQQRVAAQIICSPLGSRGCRQASGRLPVCWILHRQSLRAHERRERGRAATNVTGTQRYLNEHARWIVRLSCICSTACTACSGRCAVGSGSKGNAKLCPFVKIRFSGARRSLALAFICDLPLHDAVSLWLTICAMGSRSGITWLQGRTPSVLSCRFPHPVEYDRRHRWLRTCGPRTEPRNAE